MQYIFIILYFQFYVKLEKLISTLFKSNPDWGGPHLCHLALDRLAGYVNDGILQTVVDQVNRDSVNLYFISHY